MKILVNKETRVISLGFLSDGATINGSLLIENGEVRAKGIGSDYELIVYGSALDQSLIGYMNKGCLKYNYETLKIERDNELIDFSIRQEKKIRDSIESSKVQIENYKISPWKPNL